MMKKRALFTDFDGVLHRVHSPHELTIATAGICELQEERPDLFGWSGHLADVLEGHDCDLIVHSSWRAYMLESDIRAVLPQRLRRRFIGVTPRDTGREPSIEMTVRRMGLESNQILILDDERNLFIALKKRLVVCDPHKGVSDPVAKEAIRAWLENRESP